MILFYHKKGYQSLCFSVKQSRASKTLVLNIFYQKNRHYGDFVNELGNVDLPFDLQQNQHIDLFVFSVFLIVSLGLRLFLIVHQVHQVVLKLLVTGTIVILLFLQQ